MRTRARRWSTLASGLLAISLLAAPGALAAAPSADDPAATVTGMLETLAAKDFAGIGAFVCAEKREAVSANFDIERQLGSLGSDIDLAALMAGLTVSTAGVTVTVSTSDAATATVNVAGALTLDITDEAARVFVGQILSSQGMEVTDELLDQYTPLLTGQLETPQDISTEVLMVVEGGVWLVCDDFGGVPGQQPGPTPSAAASLAPGASGAPAASLPPMDPAALSTLMAAIPAALQPFCAPDSYWQVPDLGPDPGEIASVDCDPDGSGGDYVTYSLFQDAATMDAFYDTQLAGMRTMGGVDGPGCPTGPGEATWDHGRRFCYQAFGDDANMRWTHDELAITASAINDDGDWAALETFFAAAGPVAP